MPRPGPRPYECLKKAWHSDRHQPMRGSLIQEIFRVVNEIHSPETKKNKEWQEKLPVVVLKAEEIIYSKANSEAEYMDLSTLWERTNDAIDTIIRKEDSTETGDLLQPCIEAALILGCTARRASRSQRNINPRSYLHPTTQETTAPSPVRASPNVAHGVSSRLPSLQMNKPASTSTHYSSSSTTRSVPINSTQLRWETGSLHPDHYNPAVSPVFPFPSQNLSQSAVNQVHSMAFPPLENLGRIYPLYYGAQNQTTDPQVGLQTPYVTHSSSTLPGVSQAHCVRQPNERVFLQKFFSCDGVVNASARNPEADLRNMAENPPNIKCDLSLSLGSLSFPSGSRDAKCAYGVEDNRATTSQEGSKSCYLYPRTSNELCFFPSEIPNEPLESSSSKWSSRGEGTDLDGSSRKRKAPASNLVEASHVSHNPKLLTDLFFDRMKKPDK